MSRRVGTYQVGLLTNFSTSEGWYNAFLRARFGKSEKFDSKIISKKLYFFFDDKSVDIFWEEFSRE